MESSLRRVDRMFAAMRRRRFALDRFNQVKVHKEEEEEVGS